MSATVYLSVFDVQVSQLHQKLDMLVELKVVLATNINPKFLGGQYLLPSISV